MNTAQAALALERAGWPAVADDLAALKKIEGLTDNEARELC